MAVMTNDGHAILREIDVKHPAAKSMIELSRAQDEEVGDGTTSVIILAGELSLADSHYRAFFLNAVFPDMCALLQARCCTLRNLCWSVKFTQL